MGKFTIGLYLVASVTIVGCAPTPVMPTSYTPQVNYRPALVTQDHHPYIVPIVNRYYSNPTYPTLRSAPAYNPEHNSYPNQPPLQPYSPPFLNAPFMPSDVPLRQALLAQAHQHLGTSYKFGGQSPLEGFDCSGLTSYIYRTTNGITLPRTAAEQAQATRTISFEQIRPGDLIFFRTGGAGINHVGIYIGNNNFIHAASGGGKVTLDSLGRTYWQQRLAKFGTVLA